MLWDSSYNYTPLFNYILYRNIYNTNIICAKQY